MKVDTIDLSANLPLAIEATKHELLYNYQSLKTYHEFSTSRSIYKNTCITLCRILSLLLNSVVIEKDSELELTLEKLESIMSELDIK